MILDRFNLSGKVAIVTGSSTGLGEGMAIGLAEAGADIVGVYNKDLPQNQERIEAQGRRFLGIQADLSSLKPIAGIIQKAVTAFGRIDILVNNAGITRDQLVMRMSDEDWDTVLNIDLKSAFLCTRAVLRHMVRQRWGRIISIASIVGLTGNAGQANYAAAKAGIIGFTRSVAKEVASRGITANAIAPGFIDTKMTHQLDEKQSQELMKRIPVGYPGSPRDVAEAVAFLASEEARYITGQVLNVDGGMAGV
jgi:3-oxoacyl-[acyl-carrier protein] reductase